MKASEQQALIPQEATPDTLIDLIGKTQQVTKAAAGCVDWAGCWFQPPAPVLTVGVCAAGLP